MLIVAINKYHGTNALQLPVKDAQDFRRQMTRVASPPPGKVKLYRNQEMRILVDEQKPHKKISTLDCNGYAKVGEKGCRGGLLAGHGISQDNAYYFIPYRPNDAGKQNDWLAGTEIVETLQICQDAPCFLRYLLLWRVGQSGQSNQYYQCDGRRARRDCVCLFHVKEQSQETEEWGNGAFTEALIEGLRGRRKTRATSWFIPVASKSVTSRAGCAI